MAENLGSRVAVLEQLFKTFHEDTREYRAESKADTKAILEKLAGLQQTVGSTASAVHTLTLQDCGARLFSAETRLTALENKTQNLPVIETEVMFWRRVLGGGIHALWKITALIVGSGGVGAAIMKYWH